MNKLILTMCFLAAAAIITAQKLPEYEPLTKDFTPIELASFIADKIVDQTKFEYEYVLQQPYADIEVIDFGQSFDRSEPGVAYALSTLYSEKEQIASIEVGRSGSLKIWINDELVFNQKGNKDLLVRFDEKTYVLPENFKVHLNKGENKILIKSGYDGTGVWKLFLQGQNMGPYAEKGGKITASLKKYAPSVDIVNWLVTGCFENTGGRGMDIVYDPENEIVLHKIYESSGRKLTWDIPRVHINSTNPGGGKFYSWSYHVGGFVWGLQRLSQETGIKKYSDYASAWCEYTLNTMPIAEYQTKELNAVRSMNWGTVERPMLDYTTAPSLPFMTRLVYEKEFPLREKYAAHAEKIMNYIINEQFRLPGGLLARKYTISPSVWADDMFMGIPYMLFSAQYTSDPVLSRKLFDDAASQIIQFNKMLYREELKLYMQACYADRPDEKIPFWSRGNGWAIWGTTEVLQHLPKNHPQYKTILKIYQNHIEGISQTQDSEGFWHNILDMPETVRESSGTAIFTLCIARGINNGWLNKKKYGPVVERGWKALKSFIDKDGNLYGVKGGTNFSTDPQDYARTPFVKSDTHGILPLIFACIEMDKYINKK